MGNQPGQPGTGNGNGSRPTTATAGGTRPTSAAAGKGPTNAATATTSGNNGVRPKHITATHDNGSDVPQTLATLRYDTPVEFGSLHIRASRSTVTTPSYSNHVWLHIYFSDTPSPATAPTSSSSSTDTSVAATTAMAMGVANEQKIMIMKKTTEGRIKANELIVGHIRDWYFIAQMGPLLTDDVKVWCLHPGFQSSIIPGTRFDMTAGRLYRYQSYGCMILPDNGVMLIDFTHSTIQSLRPSMPDSKTVMWPLDSLISLHKTEAKVDNPYFLDVLGFLPSHIESTSSLPSSFTRPLLNIICSYLDDITGQVMEAKSRFPLRLYESVRIPCPDLSSTTIGGMVSPLATMSTVASTEYLTLAMHPITTPPQWDKDHCQLLVKVPRTAGGASYWMDIRKSKVRAIVPVSSSWDANISVECYALELSVSYTEAVAMSLSTPSTIERLWTLGRDVRWLAGDDAKLLVSPLPSSDATSISGQIEHEPLSTCIIGEEPAASSHLWKLPELDLHVFPLQLLPTNYVIKLGGSGNPGASANGGSASSASSRDNGRLYTLTTTKHCKPVSKWPCTRPSCTICTPK